MLPIVLAAGNNAQDLRDGPVLCLGIAVGAGLFALVLLAVG